MGWGFDSMTTTTTTMKPHLAQLATVIDSIQCPRCNGESKVIDSRDGESARRRRRECLRCKNRYSTYEIQAEEYDKLRALKIDMGQIDAAIITLTAIRDEFGDLNGHRQR